MISFKEFYFESVNNNFEDILDKLKNQGFIIKEGLISGEEMVLIFPAHIGVEWTEDNMNYRSSIWRKSDRHPVSLSFPKFFNYGERADLVPDPTTLLNTSIRTKYDGSTLITSTYKNEIIHRTRGTFDATQLDTGYEIAELKKKYPKAFNNQYINSEEYSILYEWVSPANKIILDYGAEPDIFMIGVVRHNGYKLLGQSYVDEIAKEIGVLRPKEFKFSGVADMIRSIKELKGEEGICLYYGPEGQCIKKVKSDEYLRLHKFKSNLTPKNMIEMYFGYEMPEYNEFLKFIERDFDYENMTSSVELVKQIIDAKEEFDNEMKQIEKLVIPLRSLSRAEAAKYIMSKFDRSKTWMAFNALDGKDTSEQKLKDVLLNNLKED